jgi:hypothetical protein
MSGQLDQLLTAPPARAKQLLQEAGLNYFLIAQDSRLVDLLPYSKLFAPDAIGDYLGIKWTDGKAFLLTWTGPDTTPLTPEFFKIYRELLDRPEMTWFRFSRLIPQIVAATEQLRAKPWGAPATFPWRTSPPEDGMLDIVAATYGENCRSHTPRYPDFNDVERGNATGTLREECAGKSHCGIHWEAQRVGDPAHGCEKDLTITYRCRSGPASPVRTVVVPAEASGKSVDLDCPLER